MADASVFDWLQIICLGGLMGAIGQGARTVIGLKKVNDAAASSAVSASDLFTASRILVSFAIGFIAGAVAAITIIKSIANVSPNSSSRFRRPATQARTSSKGRSAASAVRTRPPRARKVSG